MPKTTGCDGAEIAARLANMDQADATGFVRETLAERRLHVVIRALNGEVLQADTARKAMARAALDRMGFV